MKIAQALNILNPTDHTVDAIKLAHRKAAFRYHPDRDPDGLEMMKMINLAYEVLLEKIDLIPGINPSDTSPILDDIKNIFDRIRTFGGLHAEVCGTWLWITGDTKPYKETFKDLGMRWSRNKVAWYWRPADYKKWNNHNFSLDEIRAMHGSSDLEFEEAEALA